jgi:hypothetical protein
VCAFVVPVSSLQLTKRHETKLVLVYMKRLQNSVYVRTSPSVCETKTLLIVLKWGLNRKFREN